MQHEKDPLPHGTLSGHCESDKLRLSDGAGMEHTAYGSEIIAEGCVTNVSPNFLW